MITESLLPSSDQSCFFFFLGFFFSLFRVHNILVVFVCSLVFVSVLYWCKKVRLLVQQSDTGVSCCCRRSVEVNGSNEATHRRRPGDSFRNTADLGPAPSRRTTTSTLVGPSRSPSPAYGFDKHLVSAFSPAGQPLFVSSVTLEREHVLLRS